METENLSLEDFQIQKVKNYFRVSCIFEKKHDHVLV